MTRALFLAVLCTVCALCPGAARAVASPDLSLIVEPEQGYQPIYSLLASARHNLDLTMYELDDPGAEHVLAADARRGVSVRVLLDRTYIGDENEPAFSYLERHGVHVRWASSHVEITHEKSFVVDNRTVVIMTGNFTSEYYASDRDFAVVDTNPDDVAAVARTFDADWANKQVEPAAGHDLVWSPGSEDALVSLIDSARSSLLVENEELSASGIVGALADAAHRGVDVRLVMTRSPEWDHNLDLLAAAGVHVRTYSPSAALYIHAKAIDVDNARVFVGSENFSVESLVYNRELGLVTSVPAIVSVIGRTLTSDFNHGEPWES